MPPRDALEQVQANASTALLCSDLQTEVYYREKSEAPARTVCPVGLVICREFLELVSEGVGFSLGLCSGHWRGPWRKHTVDFRGSPAQRNFKSNRQQNGCLKGAWTERVRDGGPAKVGEGMGSGLWIFEHRVFCSHGFLSCHYPERLLRKERVDRGSGSLHPRPHCLLFLCNQRTGGGQAHMPRAPALIFRAPVLALGPQPPELRHATRRLLLPRLLQRRWHHCFLPWSGAFQRPRPLTVRGQVEGEKRRARHTLDSWSDTVIILSAHIPGGGGGSVPNAYAWLASEPWAESKPCSQNKRFPN